MKFVYVPKSRQFINLDHVTRIFADNSGSETAPKGRFVVHFTGGDYTSLLAEDAAVLLKVLRRESPDCANAEAT